MQVISQAPMALYAPLHLNDWLGAQCMDNSKQAAPNHEDVGVHREPWVRGRSLASSPLCKRRRSDSS